VLQNIVIVAVTEFGRTVEVNGSLGPAPGMMTTASPPPPSSQEAPSTAAA